jgi:hypothetical protein
VSGVELWTRRDWWRHRSVPFWLPTRAAAVRPRPCCASQVCAPWYSTAPVQRSRRKAKAADPSVSLSPWQNKTAATASGLRHVTPGSGAREPQRCQVLEATLRGGGPCRVAWYVDVGGGATVLTPGFGPFRTSGAARPGRALAGWMDVSRLAPPRRCESSGEASCQASRLSSAPSEMLRAMDFTLKRLTATASMWSEMGQVLSTVRLRRLLYTAGEKDNGKR